MEKTYSTGFEKHRPFNAVISTMILLHGFIKKSKKTPKIEIETARKRKNKIEVYYE